MHSKLAALLPQWYHLTIGKAHNIPWDIVPNSRKVMKEVDNDEGIFNSSVVIFFFTRSL